MIKDMSSMMKNNYDSKAYFFSRLICNDARTDINGL